MKVYYHGHSFVEIEASFWNILIDPFITGNSQWLRPLEFFLEKSIHTIILTHGHSDHIGDTMELAHKSECRVVTTYELWTYLQKINMLKNVHSMWIWGQYDFKDFKVKFVPAIHGWWIGGLDTYHHCTPAWVILRLEWKNIYHAGDTALTMDMKLLWEYDSIDLAFLPIGDNYTMWIDDAVIATSFIKPKKVVPIHYNTFPLIQVKPDEFVYKVWEIGRLMTAGESIDYDREGEHDKKI